MTPVRRALLESFAELPHGCTVPQLLAVLAKKKITPNKTTLYRQLASLVESGCMQSVQVGGATRFELVADGRGHHHHFVCTRCERATELPLTRVESELEKVESDLRARGFQPRQHALEIFGLCSMCAK